MAKRLTPEEKAVRALQRKLDKEAERQAKIAERAAAWKAQRNVERAAFEASLDDHSRAAIAAILVPTGETVNEYDGLTVPTFENDFIKSLYSQLAEWGKLSPAQLATVIRQYDSKLEYKKLTSIWPSVSENDAVMVLCAVTAIEQRPSTGYGPSWKIKLKSHYGRIFQINTAAKRFLSVAEVALKEGTKVNVQGTAGWVSPDARIVVLNKKGLYFQGL